MLMYSKMHYYKAIPICSSIRTFCRPVNINIYWEYAGELSHVHVVFVPVWHISSSMLFLAGI